MLILLRLAAAAAREARTAERATWAWAREGGLKLESSTRSWRVLAVLVLVGAALGGWVCRICTREAEAAKAEREEENWVCSL